MLHFWLKGKLVSPWKSSKYFFFIKGLLNTFVAANSINTKSLVKSAEQLVNWTQRIPLKCAIGKRQSE